MSSKFRRFFFCVLVLSYIHQINIFADLKHLGFGFDNEKKSVTIPFISYNNLIIIESVIDEKIKLNLILDTGIRSLVLFNKSYIPKVSNNTFNLMFTGAGNPTPIEAEVSINHTLRLSEDVVANQINAVILNRSNKYLHELKGTKIHGAFGYQLFTRFQVKIDYKNQLITLIEPHKASVFHGFESIPISIHDTKPFVEANFLAKKGKWKKLNLIIDLGANHKILLHDHINNKGSNINSLKQQRIAEGLSGSIYGRKEISKSIRLGSITFNDTEILIPTNTSYSNESINNIEKHGSIGGKFFNKSTIILDYINGYLFIENSKNEIDPPKPKHLLVKKIQ